jgi:transcriptional regulator with XRE-family HTH domain
MDDLYKHIGTKIRDLRENHAGTGLSQQELAKVLNASANTISRWETGTYRISVEDIHRLARFFGVPISVFFPDMENSPVQALTSATGGLKDEDIQELIQYAQFRKARQKLKSAAKPKRK